MVEYAGRIYGGLDVLQTKRGGEQMFLICFLSNAPLARTRKVVTLR